jgi:hypothetical protein
MAEFGEELAPDFDADAVSAHYASLGYDPHAAAVLTNVDLLRARCVASGTAFSDPEFCGRAALGVGFTAHDRVAEQWARISEISTSPTIASGGVFAPENLDQGELGDCWCVAITFLSVASKCEDFPLSGNSTV